MHPLRKARRDLGYSQKMLADFTGISVQTVKRVEAGREIRAANIRIICDHFTEKYKREVKPSELGLISEEKQDGDKDLYSSDQDTPIKQDETKISLVSTRYLNMEPEKLIKRYENEKEKLIRLKTDSIEWTIPEVIIFDNTRDRLPMTAISAQIDKEQPEYIIPEKIAGRAKDILEEIEHHFFDSTTIRLNSIQSNKDSITLTVSKAHYMQYVATNYAMDALLKEKGWTRSLRDVVHPTKQLCKLEESPLCNHIGVGTFVFTLDNYLVLPIRSEANIATWKEMIGPSIAGATSYDDDMWSRNAGPVASWMREGREELGLENSDFLDEKDIFFGITRDLLRGGKPEMYYATQINVTRAKLEEKFRKARDKWENKELRWLEFTNPLVPPTTEQERTTFLQEFSHLLNLYQGQLSRPAQIGFTFWFKYMMSLF